MIFVGDIFAIALVAVLTMFYWDGRTRPRYMPVDSKLFLASLIFVALTAAVDILTCFLIETPGTPLWLDMSVNSLYFVINIVATSSIALFLFTKILEHAHDNH